MNHTRGDTRNPPSQLASIVEEKSNVDLHVEHWLLVMVALSVALAPLNSTMIAIALPNIIQDLNANVTTAGWLVTGYLIAMASLQPVAGKLGDRLGRRTLMLGGLVYFGVVSLGATLAPNLPLLLLFRIQQGIAGAIVLPNGMALLREVVPAERRAGALWTDWLRRRCGCGVGPPLRRPAGWSGRLAGNLSDEYSAPAAGSTYRLALHSAQRTQPSGRTL